MADRVEQVQRTFTAYAVERELGTGGMATVYLAHDKKHDRKVAIKILHAELAALLGAERFLQEIRVTANLQHPHILGLIDSGLIGDDAGELKGRPYYVMPYLEGESLRQRLEKEQELPVSDSVRIATEVASALDYAHRHNVIHRDIKPENILLHDGSAIVADFGIALAVTQAGGERITESGVSLGTPIYMSPEQAAGERALTGRTDIYSLGVVTYEMLSGEPPFKGSSARAVAARVMTEEPRSLTTLRRNVPPHVAAAVSRAIEKVPADRFASAHEFAEALNNPSFTLCPTSATLGRGRSIRRLRWMLYGVTALAALFLAIAIWGWMRPAPSKQVVRYTLLIDSTEAMIAGTSWWGRLAISPDGSRLAYIGAASARLLIRPFNQLHATAVQEVEGANSPFFSPDGQHVGFLTDGHVHIASINGGSPITVTDSLTGLGGASWARDGLIYVHSQGGAGLLQVEPTPGAVPKRFTVLNTASGEVSHAWPDVLPNGKGVLFTVTFNGRNGVKGSISQAIAVAEIPSGKHQMIENDAVYARYSTSGHLLFVTTNGTLMIVRFDQNSMKPTGEPTALIEGIHLGGGAADLAISATGTLVYGIGAGEAKQELVWVTRNGKARSVDPDWTGYFWSPALSADGKRLAVARSVGGPLDVWVKQLDRGPSIKLTLEGTGQLPTWTPDGRSVTFTLEDSTGSGSVWTRRADGGARALLQFREKRGAYAARWSPDGKWLIFETDLNRPGLGDILGIRPGIDTVAVPLVATTRFTETSPAVSPDGRWLAYSSNESGQYEIYVVPFPNTRAQRWVVSTHGGTEPLWSHRENELFYRDGAGYLVAVDVKTNPTLSLGRSTPLFPAAGFDSLLWAARYAVAPDDRRFLMIRPVAASAPDKLIVVHNWFEELKSRK